MRYLEGKEGCQNCTEIVLRYLCMILKEWIALRSDGGGGGGDNKDAKGAQ